jgi:hypothetical protein
MKSGGEARIAEPPASRQNTVNKIDAAEAVWSAATFEGKHVGGEARIAEPPASRQNTVNKIDTAKAVWSKATY